MKEIVGKNKGCPKGHQGVPGITNNLVCLYVDGEKCDFSNFINFYYEDGALLFKIDINGIREKHNVRDYEIQVLFSKS